MYAMTLDNIVYALTQQHIKDPQKREKAIVFSFGVGLWDHSLDTHRRHSIHFLLYSPYGGEVYTYVSKNKSIFQNPLNIPVEDWEFLTRHDSCWRSAVRDYCWSNYSNAAGKINEARVDNGMEKIAPKNMTQHIHPIDNMMSFARVEQIKDPNAEHNYKTILTKIEAG